MPKEKPRMVGVEALKPHSYGGLLYDPGDIYEAVEKEAETLAERGWVKVGGTDKRLTATSRMSAGKFVPWQPWRGGIDR